MTRGTGRSATLRVARGSTLQRARARARPGTFMTKGHPRQVAGFEDAVQGRRQTLAWTLPVGKGPPQAKASDGKSDVFVQGSDAATPKAEPLRSSVKSPFSEDEAGQSDSSESTEVALSNTTRWKTGDSVANRLGPHGVPRSLSRWSWRQTVRRPLQVLSARRPRGRRCRVFFAASTFRDQRALPSSR